MHASHGPAWQIYDAQTTSMSLLSDAYHLNAHSRSALVIVLLTYELVMTGT